MPIYNYGLGIDTTTVETSSGDELAKAADYTIPAGVDYAYHTWKNLPISDSTVEKLVYEE